MTHQNMYLCPVCRTNVPASEAIHIKTRYYHKKNNKKKIKEETGKIKTDKKVKKERDKANSYIEKEVRIREAVSEEDAVMKKKIIDKIKEILNIEYLDTKYYVSLDRIKDKYLDFTWEGIYNALVYFYEIKENPPYDNLVGIIPDIYTEANNFFKNLEKIKSEPIDSMYKTKKIKVTLRKKHKQYIDIDKLGE